MKVASSILVFAVLAMSALAQPQVTGTVPPELQGAESRQWITVVGSGFTPTSTVTLAWGERLFQIPADRTEFVNPQSIRIFAGIFPADPTWTVTVTNPDGTASRPTALTFTTNQEPAPPQPDAQPQPAADEPAPPAPQEATPPPMSPQVQAAIDRAPERLAQLMGAVQGIQWSRRTDEWFCSYFADTWWHEADRFTTTTALVSHPLDSDDEVSLVRDAIDAAARRLNYYPQGWVRNMHDPIHFGTVEDPGTRFDNPRVRFEFVLFQRPAGSLGVYGCGFAVLLER